MQNALFYVLSDDIETSKILLEEKIKEDYPIKFPGNGIDHRPGMITYRNQVLHRGIGEVDAYNREILNNLI